MGFDLKSIFDYPVEEETATQSQDESKTKEEEHK